LVPATGGGNPAALVLAKEKPDRKLCRKRPGSIFMILGVLRRAPNRPAACFAGLSLIEGRLKFMRDFGAPIRLGSECNRSEDQPSFKGRTLVLVVDPKRNRLIGRLVNYKRNRRLEDHTPDGRLVTRSAGATRGKNGIVVREQRLGDNHGA
jgi:hypothetical protein